MKTDSISLDEFMLHLKGKPMARVSTDTIAAKDAVQASRQYGATHPNRRVIRVKRLGRVSDAKLAAHLGCQPFTNPWAPYWYRVTFQERE